MPTERLAPIEPDTLYPLSVFENLAGLGRHAMREARKLGLVARKVGSRKFVLGSDFIDFVKEHGKVEAD